MKSEGNGNISRRDRTPAISQDKDTLVHDLKGMIDETRSAVAIAVNAGLTLLYWRIGKRIREDVLGEERAQYGQEILATLSQELVREYGNGFSYSALTRMVKFAEVFPDEKIVATLSRQLSWSHFRELLPLDKPLQREFYAEMCRVERWSVRALRKKIDAMLYERTALSKKPDELAKAELEALRDEDRLSPDLVFRDPYFLDFLGLNDCYLEKDLEDAILRELEQFLLELGGGFSFLARQKRIQIDSPVQVRLEGETVWLNQKLMAELYGVSVPTINEHISNIYEDEELAPEATIRKYRIVQTEGSGTHFSMQKRIPGPCTVAKDGRRAPGAYAILLTG